MALHGGEQDRDIGGVPDEMTCLDYLLRIWEGDDFRTRQGDQGSVIREDLLGVGWWKRRGMV